MAVQWSGPAADAAVAGLRAAGLRGGAGTGELPPTVAAKRRTVSAGPSFVDLLVSIALPWLIFSLVIALFLFTYQEAPGTVWFMVHCCAVLSGSVTFTALRSGQRKLLAVGVWCFLSLGLALLLGHFLDASYLRHETRLEQGNEVKGVDADSLAGAAGDVAVVHFSNGTFVDDRRTVGYVAKGSLYCVAPVAKQATPAAPGVYWAIGIDCCGQRSDFDCGTSRMPVALAGVSYPSRQDATFQRAVRLAASIYGVALLEGQPAKLLRFAGEPSQVSSALRSEALSIAGLAVVMHFAWSVLVGGGIGSVAGRGTAGAEGREHADGVAASSAMGFPEASDPFLRGGARDGSSSELRVDAPQRAGSAAHAAVPQQTMQEALPETTELSKLDDTQESKAIQSKSKLDWLCLCFDLEARWDDDAARKKWKETSKAKEEPVFFDTLYIAKDGGFSEVKQRFEDVDSMYYLTAMVTPALVIFNVYYVLRTDLSFISDRAGHKSMDSMYLLTSDFVIQPVGALIARFTGQEKPTVPATLVFAAAEMLVMALKIFLVFWQLGRIFCTKEYRRWYFVYQIFLHQLPELCSFSAMCMLTMSGLVVPAELFKELVFNFRKEKGIKGYIRVVVSILVRSIYLLIGFDAFLVKFRLNSDYMNSDSLSLSNLLGAGNFILQMLGVVQVDALLRKRLMVFTFAGPDGVMDPEDNAKYHVYFAQLAKKIYETRRSFAHFVAVMLNFNDYDFQSLVLNEQEKRKEEMDSQTSAASAERRGGRSAERQGACC